MNWWKEMWPMKNAWTEVRNIWQYSNFNFPWELVTEIKGGKENHTFDNSIQVGNLFGKLDMNQSECECQKEKSKSNPNHIDFTSKFFFLLI